MNSEPIVDIWPWNLIIHLSMNIFLYRYVNITKNLVSRLWGIYFTISREIQPTFVYRKKFTLDIFLCYDNMEFIRYIFLRNPVIQYLSTILNFLLNISHLIRKKVEKVYFIFILFYGNKLITESLVRTFFYEISVNLY